MKIWVKKKLNLSERYSFIKLLTLTLFELFFKYDSHHTLLKIQLTNHNRINSKKFTQI